MSRKVKILVCLSKRFIKSLNRRFTGVERNYGNERLTMNVVSKKNLMQFWTTKERNFVTRKG